MSTFIARRVEERKDGVGGLESARELYRAYFIKTKIYAKYKADCDIILETDGYKDCIVTE